MSYMLGTTENKVRWYKFDPSNIQEGVFELLEVLDLQQVPTYPDKKTAKEVAKRLGLQTWRYFKY